MKKTLLFTKERVEREKSKPFTYFLSFSNSAILGTSEIRDKLLRQFGKINTEPSQTDAVSYKQSVFINWYRFIYLYLV